jgi:hypothetical protein
MKKLSKLIKNKTKPIIDQYLNRGFGHFCKRELFLKEAELLKENQFSVIYLYFTNHTKA